MIKQRAARGALTATLVAFGLQASAAPGLAQVQAIDPDAELNRDLGRSGPAGSTAPPFVPPPQVRAVAPPASSAEAEPLRSAPAPGFDLGPPTAPRQGAPQAPLSGGETYQREDLVNAAEGVFGKGARDVAVAIGDVLKKQGQPNGYIVGSEGGGAFIFGLRYGSGTLYQKTAAPRPVYWSGPSVGFDAGANGGNTFVLVYNLADQETLFTRFGAGEGQAYVIGGVTVSYLRHGNMVLIPVRMGVGLRLGVNAGYMKFSRRQNWVPF